MLIIWPLFPSHTSPQNKTQNKIIMVMMKLEFSSSLAFLSRTLASLQIPLKYFRISSVWPANQSCWLQEAAMHSACPAHAPLVRCPIPANTRVCWASAIDHCLSKVGCHGTLLHRLYQPSSWTWIPARSHTKSITLTSLGLQFYICKLGIIIVFIPQCFWWCSSTVPF